MSTLLQAPHQQSRTQSHPAAPSSPSSSGSSTSSSPTSSPRRRHRRLAVGAGVALVLVALAVPLGLHGTGSGPVAEHTDARGSGSAGTALTGKGHAGSGTAPSPSSGMGTAASDGAQASSGAAVGSSDLTVIAPKVSRTAWLGIKVSDLAGSAARARVVATDAGGQVTSENVVTSVDPTGGPTSGPVADQTPSSSGVQSPDRSAAALPDVGVDQARLVLNVPAKALDEVLTQLSRLGTVSYRSSQSQDVTDTYVDTKSRVQPMRDGIDRLRALLARTTDLQQVITLEDELSRRQADLDSLTQRLAQLDAMTTTSDVTVSLWTDTTPVPAQAGGGIAGGLRTAWESLLGSLTVVLTGLAALLPWLLVVVPLALLGLRLWRRHRAGASATSGSSASGTSDPTP